MMRHVRLFATALTLVSAAALGGVVTAGPAAAATYTCGNQGKYYTGTAVTGQGNTGNRVIEAQCLLKSSGYLTAGQVDGVFGTNTYNAVRSFQTMYRKYCNSGVAVDGVVGRDTWAALRGPCPA
ncbi:peptidoglycan-binding protein [Streptomyces sp. NBC_00435]|uniref:peptidoglycan-binding domain-containing protein n=1 Tax=Streptomyces sp. NBC_00435 TaxID=2903649 RepID=UPI002E217F38